MSVIIETSLGNIVIDLYTDERPKCCQNFLKLCKIKYYNFCVFHSVQRNLVAQTGDPTGTGRGGESVYMQIFGDQARYFDMEIIPRMKHTKAGLISMVNNGQNGHGSQFFITLGNNVDYLDGKHTVFAEVTEGMDIVSQINEAYVDKDSRPYKDIRINHTIILDDPSDDLDGLTIPDRSPEPTAEQLKSMRIGADEDIDDFKGKTEEEIKEYLDDKEAKANTQILTMVGDLPNEEVKPEDNVLFVCKLNPVTTDEDLEVIFSRFGKITSCEVVKDHKSGESLQYAFIEFEKGEECERAYFKMDNVLIDDRRIHVDFSQSVSKVKWNKKGKEDETKQNVESFESRYAIKGSDRKDNKYDLVFEEVPKDQENVTDNKKKKKKHRDDRDSDSESSTNSKKKKKKKKQKKKDRSSSEERDSSQERREKQKKRSPDRKDARASERGASGRSNPRSIERRSSDRNYRDTIDRDSRNRRYKRDSSDERGSRGFGNSDKQPPKRDDWQRNDSRNDGGRRNEARRQSSEENERFERRSKGNRDKSDEDSHRGRKRRETTPDEYLDRKKARVRKRDSSDEYPKKKGPEKHSHRDSSEDDNRRKDRSPKRGGSVEHERSKQRDSYKSDASKIRLDSKNSSKPKHHDTSEDSDDSVYLKKSKAKSKKSRGNSEERSKKKKKKSKKSSREVSVDRHSQSSSSKKKKKHKNKDKSRSRSR